MIRTCLCLLLASLMAISPAAAATIDQLRQTAVQIPLGSVVEVKLISGKLRGQLLSLDQEGVKVRTAPNPQQVVEQDVPFAQMKNIKQVDTSSRATKGLAVFGGVMLVWMIVFGIIYAAAGGA